MSIYHDGTIPVHSDKGPSKWPANDWHMDETWVCCVAEVQGAEVEEVDHQEQLRPPEVTPNKKHYEAECKKVMDDKVRSDRCSGIDVVDIRGE